MMPFHTYEFGRSRMLEAERIAARHRANQELEAAARPGGSVADTVGHGLIAIGARLVADPQSHPTHSRAA